MTPTEIAPAVAGLVMIHGAALATRRWLEARVGGDPRVAALGRADVVALARRAGRPAGVVIDAAIAIAEAMGDAGVAGTHVVVVSGAGEHARHGEIEVVVDIGIGRRPRLAIVGLVSKASVALAPATWGLVTAMSAAGRPPVHAWTASQMFDPHAVTGSIAGALARTLGSSGGRAIVAGFVNPTLLVPAVTAVGVDVDAHGRVERVAIDQRSRGAEGRRPRDAAREMQPQR